MEMISICPRNTFTGERDRAIMLILLDTGMRASELVHLNIEDVDQVTGVVQIREGKGGKPRRQFLGARARKALRTYLRVRMELLHRIAQIEAKRMKINPKKVIVEDPPHLWMTQHGTRISYWGLSVAVRFRASKAKVKPPSLHSFRRWFALTCLRNGMDVYSLQQLMGHSDLQVLRRYLKQTDMDLKEAHQRASPVDNLPR